MLGALLPLVAALLKWLLGECCTLGWQPFYNNRTRFCRRKWLPPTAQSGIGLGCLFLGCTLPFLCNTKLGCWPCKDVRLEPPHNSTLCCLGTFSRKDKLFKHSKPTEPQSFQVPPNTTFAKETSVVRKVIQEIQVVWVFLTHVFGSARDRGSHRLWFPLE